MDIEKIGDSARFYCNTCRVNTNQQLRYSCDRESDREVLWDQPRPESHEYELWTYSLWVCMGCDTATLQEEHEIYVDEESTGAETVLHPRRGRENLPFKVFLQLDERLSRIYREIIKSFNNDAGTLCAIGLRTLLEGICAEKQVKGKTLYHKIDNLTEYLPPNIVENLHRFRFTGNEAAHELQAPSRSDLAIAIEVMEDLLNYLYELDYKTQSLFAKTGVASTPAEKPNPTAIKQMIERKPSIQQHQKELYKFLYQAGDIGLSISHIAAKMGRTENQIFGVLGALGRRINNTEGIEENPGIGYIFELIDDDGSKEYPGWGWKMRPELRSVLKSGNYDWMK